MGRKSKLKQLNRQLKTASNCSDWANELNVINIDVNDDNWLYHHAQVFNDSAKVIFQGSVDLCLDRACKEHPTLNLESREQMRFHCGEYGILEGRGWHIIYKPIQDRNNEPWSQSNIDKFNAAIASVKLN